MEDVVFTWRTSGTGGGLGEEIRVRVPTEDFAQLLAAWGRIKGLPAGPERSALIAELRTLCDLYAVFPGGTLTDPEEEIKPWHRAAALATAPPAVRQALQASLLDEPLPDPGRKEIGHFHAPEHGAPETQRLAAIAVYAKSGTQRRQVLDLIAASGDRGRTDEELESILHGRHQTVSARRNELAGDGWIQDSRMRRKTTSGRQAVVWIVTDQAREQMA